MWMTWDSGRDATFGIEISTLYYGVWRLWSMEIAPFSMLLELYNFSQPETKLVMKLELYIWSPICYFCRRGRGSISFSQNKWWTRTNFIIIWKFDCNSHNPHNIWKVKGFDYTCYNLAFAHNWKIWDSSFFVCIWA